MKNFIKSLIFLIIVLSFVSCATKGELSDLDKKLSQKLEDLQKKLEEISSKIENKVQDQNDSQDKKDTSKVENKGESQELANIKSSIEIIKNDIEVIKKLGKIEKPTELEKNDDKFEEIKKQLDLYKSCFVESIIEIFQQKFKDLAKTYDESPDNRDLLIFKAKEAQNILNILKKLDSKKFDELQNMLNNYRKNFE